MSVGLTDLEWVGLGWEEEKGVVMAYSWGLGWGRGEAAPPFGEEGAR